MENVNSIIKDHIMESELDRALDAAKKKTAMDYLGAYVQANKADDLYTQAIWIQFGRSASRWDVDHKRYNAATKQALSDKLHADHEMSRLLHIMREAGASISDLEVEGEI